MCAGIFKVGELELNRRFLRQEDLKQKVFMAEGLEIEGF